MMRKKTIAWLLILTIISLILRSAFFMVLGLLIIYIRSKDPNDWITKKTFVILFLFILAFGLEIILGIGLFYGVIT